MAVTAREYEREATPKTGERKSMVRWSTSAAALEELGADTADWTAAAAEEAVPVHGQVAALHLEGGRVVEDDRDLVQASGSRTRSTRGSRRPDTLPRPP